ncbi:MAG: hypothetical protein J7M40_07810 [Planctomycetes bacterium]|nr:hypothetical protein [Planctomycetota bacterium]
MEKLENRSFKINFHCLYFGERGFIGCHTGYGGPVYRAVELLPDALYILDWSLEQALSCDELQDQEFLPGYSLLLRKGFAWPPF